MDELTLLRNTRDDVAEPSAAALRSARAALLDRANAPHPLPARHHPVPHARWVWGGTAGLVSASAIITALVITSTVSQPASAAAVAVLDTAARLVIADNVDPVVGPGQYLRIRETFDLVTLWDVDVDSDAITDAPGWGSTFAVADGAVRAEGVRDLYVPSDRSGDWILDDRQTNQVLDVYGGPGTLPAYEQMVADIGERDADPDGLDRLPAGLQTFGSGTTAYQSYYDPLHEDYAGMPRDPRQLLDWYRQHLPGPGAPDDMDFYVFQSIGRYLSTDLMPADLRAASLRALGLITGVDVARTVGPVTTLELPVTLDEDIGDGDLLTSELDIDTSTGRIVGSREFYPHRTTDIVPAGIPYAAWRMDVTVVDNAPQP